MRNRPGIVKLFSTDYFFFLGGIASVMGIGIGLYLYVGEQNLTGGIISAAVVAVSLAILIWRWVVTTHLFSSGIEEKGIVKRLFFYRGRANFIVTYTRDDVEYKVVLVLMRNALTTRMSQGMEVTLLVNPNKLKQALILDVFE